MAWIARDKYNDLYIYMDKPKRDETSNSDFAMLSYKADKKLIHKTITWDDEPVELK